MIVTPGSGDIATVKMQHEINLTQKSRKFFSILRCAETFFSFIKEKREQNYVGFKEI